MVTAIARDDKSITRQAQYISGICDIHERFSDIKNLDLFIADNTINNEVELNPLLREALEKIAPERKFFKLDNDYGRLNKGCGLIAQWKNILPNIQSGYDFIIHYEPRQTLKSQEFFERFLKDRTNMFKEDAVIAYKFRIFLFRYHHFQTGLFACHTETLLNFAKNQDLSKMVKKSQSIERLLYMYFKIGCIKYERVDQLGILWDSGNGYRKF